MCLFYQQLQVLITKNPIEAIGKADVFLEVNVKYVACHATDTEPKRHL